ncbi:MAG: YdeI/OmpD-associated family protein [Dermatophilaceae bacterium]
MPSFEAVLEAAETGPGCGIRLPFDGKAVFGHGRAPVVVTVAGGEPFRTRVMVYAGVSWLGVRKAQQEAFGVGLGDRVVVTVERDDAPRVVTVPLELAEALAGSPAAAAAYEALSYSHRREYAAWVDGAKREPTRRERAAKTLARLLDGLAPP